MIDEIILYDTINVSINHRTIRSICTVYKNEMTSLHLFHSICINNGSFIKDFSEYSDHEIHDYDIKEIIKIIYIELLGIIK